MREKPVREIARDLGISESGRRRSMAQAEIDKGNREGLTRDERAELVLSYASAERLCAPLRASAYSPSYAPPVARLSTGGLRPAVTLG